MPSPFPGMDPFIEGQVWKGFHTRFIAALGDLLVAQLRPRYVVQIEEYVYLAREDEEPDRLFEPDLAIVEGPRETPRGRGRFRRRHSRAFNPHHADSTATSAKIPVHPQHAVTKNRYGYRTSLAFE